MSRLEQVEKYCQEISRDKPQSKDSRTFKDEEDEAVVNGEGDLDTQAAKAQTNGTDKQNGFYEPQVTREEFEKLVGRIVNMERNLFNFELVRLRFDLLFTHKT